MWWWKKKQSVQALELQDSFGRMQQDTHALYQWIEYLYRLNLSQHNSLKSVMEKNDVLSKTVEELRSHATQHKQLLEELHAKLHTAKTTPQEIKAIIDGHYAFDQLHSRMQVVEQKLTNLHAPHEPLQESVKIPSFKEKILRRISRNSKEYIKGVIRSLILKYGKISALQLRDIVVEEQGLCSKSSFYRLLDEVESDESIMMEQQGKEKEYFAKLTSRNDATQDDKS